MKKIIGLMALLMAFQFVFCQNTAKLEEVMSTYARQNKFNGAALVVYKGQIVLDNGYGWRNVADSSRHTTGSIFQIGSITKQFTATVILKLQETKKLNITDKLSKYFPDYPKGDSITIEQLLTHTSGIYSYTDDGEFMKNSVSIPSDREKMMALFKNKPLNFSPGTQWRYSNSGYSLLGYIIEEVAKMPYEKAVRKYIFSKAGMTHSGFDFTHLAGADKSTGYFSMNKANVTPSTIVDSSVSYSAGAIYSTTGDLYQWFKAMQENSIISKASKAKAFTPVMNHYGYGWVIDSLAGILTIGHSGGIHGFTSNMVSVPEDNTTVILLDNTGSSNLQKITEQLYAVLYNKPYELPKERIAIEVAAETLQQYTGQYELMPQMVLQIKVDNGMLLGAPEGQEPLQLHPEKKDSFFVEEIDARVVFNRNEKNEIVSLTLFQNGREMTGKKK